MLAFFGGKRYNKKYQEHNKINTKNWRINKVERYYINAWRKNTLEYKDIYKLWFSDGFHEDSFENIFH